MTTKLKIASDTENLRIVEKAIDDITASENISYTCYGKIMVSVMEAVNNAVVHGNKSQPGKFVDVSLKCEEDKLTVTIRDEGPGFVPNEIPDPTLPENIEKDSGRGVFLMKKLADEVRFSEKGNEVILEFNNISV
ncbi:MAG: ATP-binding protein [Bacteroidales bacterium]|jgi:serine/threonine-protein kinase RsbW|nr:ATP-binding protein [Bacteroidales bacterium]